MQPHRKPFVSLQVVSILLLASASIGASRAATPAWTRDFGAPIMWQRVTAFGQLLVSTTDGLYAVDPESGEPRWAHRDLAGLPSEGIDEIAGSPLVLISDDRADSRTVILNVFNGALVFDSRTENITEIASTHMLPRSGTLLIAGFETGKPQPTLLLYDIEAGKRLWASEALTEGMGGLMRFMLSAAIVAADITPVQSSPLELGDGTFLLGAMGNVYRFEQATGKVLWKTQYAGGAYEFRLADARPDVAYVGAEETQTTIGADDSSRQSVQTFYQGFALADGQSLWKRPVRFNKPMNRLIIPVEQGLIVSEGDSDKGRIQLLDYDTGEPQWGKRGKGIDLSGKVIDYAVVDSNLILTTGYDSIWTNKDTEYLLYVLDPTSGSMRFEKPLAVAGRMLSTELTAQGFAYTTTHEINVFDPASGALLNPPVLKSKSPLVSARVGELVYAFNSDDGNVYRFDRASGEISRFSSAPFEFSERDSARALDVLDGRIVLLGQQTVAGFASDGSLQFARHYRAPRERTWLRALAWAEGVRAGMASAYSAAYSAAAASVAGDTEDGTLEHAMAVELQRGFGELQQGYAGLSRNYIDFARRRYQASAQSRDFVFMMVQSEDRRVQLAQVSKRDGHILAQIDLHSDKEPDYQVDDVANVIYYRPSASAIDAYSFSRETVDVALR
jgi:outer membrane protein assembly factor BamB